MFPRHLRYRVELALRDSPVVLIGGARQTGKTTLARELCASSVTLDDYSALALARSDPAGFIRGLAAPIFTNGPVLIDEVQLAPEIFPAIKAVVDEWRFAGQHPAGCFLLTGSANVLLLPKMTESLAGRMEILTLWPLAQAEMEGGCGDLLDLLFAPRDFRARFSPLKRLPGGREFILERATRGGYPEAVRRNDPARRKAWFDSYVSTILMRDIRDLASIEASTAMPRLLQLLAARAASLLNLADVGRAANLPYATLTRYVSLLETAFFITTLPAWSDNLSKRLVKAPKLLLNDSGLLANLTGLDQAGLVSQDRVFGAIVENFAVIEFLKMVGWSQVPPRAFHYRTQAGMEIDLLLERADGSLVGIEVKASSTVGPDDFRALKSLASLYPDKWIQGIVLYSGEQVLPFSETLTALPLSALWT